jgi:tetratricopeptide (TPR) repeat protein
MSCSEIAAEQLHDYLDGRLSDEEAREIRDHLLDCCICREHESELRCLLARLAELPTTAEPKRDLWPAIAAQVKTPDPFLADLSEAIAQRRVRDAANLVHGEMNRIVALNPLKENAAALLSYFTQWMEMGAAHCPIMPYVSYLKLARECLQRFPRSPRPRLSQIDSAHLRTVEGILAMHDEEYAEAINHFDHVLRLGDEINDPDLVAFAEGAIARAHTKNGAYVKAENFIDRAIGTALRSRRKEMVAVLSVRKAWILFQRNRPKEAAETYARAETVLRETDDHLTLGNVDAARGRLTRRDGEYYAALKAYGHALRHYKRCGSAQHPNLARALTNIALLRRLIALRLSTAPDQELADIDEETSRSIQRQRKKAFTHLRHATAIFERERDYRGRGSVLLISAELHTDSGDLDTAASELARAYELGEEKNDRILMARSRLQQCILQNTKARISQEPIRSYFYAEQARSFAEGANELAAKYTQNMRLTAHTFIWHGITLMNPHLLDPDQASKCYQAAYDLLKPPDANIYFVKPTGRDYVWDDLQMLGVKLKAAGCDLSPHDSGAFDLTDLNERARL